MGYYIPGTGMVSTNWDSHHKIYASKYVKPVGRHCLRDEAFLGGGGNDGVVIGMKRELDGGNYVGRHRCFLENHLECKRLHFVHLNGRYKLMRLS